ncbi:MAG: ABC transporter substrate-binding protein [Candidatus Sumerlaeota bacterium]|nr:ABC transporter substrate-binding protein [Candidatus Sumerlaeota bacterium]
MAGEWADRRFSVFAVLILIAAAGAMVAIRPAREYLGSRFLNLSQEAGNEIVWWHPFGGTTKEGIEKIARAFEQEHPGLKVRLVFTSNNLANNQKFFTAVAAGKTPTVAFVDGPQVAEWAEQGALEPLDDYIKESGINPADFFPPCWKQNVYKGHVWAMTHHVDPNFAFAWNKEVFRASGLDPEHAPETIEEMDAMVDKTTRRDANGRLATIGLIPWAQFGNANSMFTWGWVFGGSFYDEANNRVTANDPKIVKALEWMCSYGEKYDVTKVSSLQQGFGTMDRFPLYTGEMAMTCFLMSQVEDAARYAPKLDYGLSYIPYPKDGGQPKFSWIGGWCVALPRGCRNPKLGWELIRWLGATPQGTLTVAKNIQSFPAYLKSPYFESVKNHPRYKIFFDILKNSHTQRPVMPAQAYYMGALDQAVGFALYGQKTPKQALDDATRVTQEELDFILAGDKP